MPSTGPCSRRLATSVPCDASQPLYLAESDGRAATAVSCPAIKLKRKEMVDTVKNTERLQQHQTVTALHAAQAILQHTLTCNKVSVCRTLKSRKLSGPEYSAFIVLYEPSHGALHTVNRANLQKHMEE